MSEHHVPVIALDKAPLECARPVSTAASAEELTAGLDVVTGTAGSTAALAEGVAEGLEVVAGTAGMTVATGTGTGLGVAAGVAVDVTRGHSDGVSVKPGNTRVTGVADSTAGEGDSDSAGLITEAAVGEGVSAEAGVATEATGAALAGMTSTVGSAASVPDTLTLVRDVADRPPWSVKVS